MRLPPCLVAVIYVTDPPSCVYLCVLLPLHTSETYLAVSTSVSCCCYILYRPTELCLPPCLVAVTYFTDTPSCVLLRVLLPLHTLQTYLAVSTSVSCCLYIFDGRIYLRLPPCLVAFTYFTDLSSCVYLRVLLLLHILQTYLDASTSVSSSGYIRHRPS